MILLVLDLASHIEHLLIIERFQFGVKAWGKSVFTPKNGFDIAENEPSNEACFNHKQSSLRLNDSPTQFFH